MRLDSLRSRLVMRLDPLCSTMRLLLSCSVFCSIPLRYYPPYPWLFVVVILRKSYGTPFPVIVSILSVVLYHRPASMMTLLMMMTEQLRCKITLFPHNILP